MVGEIRGHKVITIQVETFIAERRKMETKTRQVNWYRKANRLWGDEAVWILGEGRFALLAPCGKLSVSLWETREEAEERKETIDKYACGGMCNRGRHEIVDLALV